jgi:hypothetical protein
VLRDLPIDTQGTISPTFFAEHGFLSATQLAQRYVEQMPEAVIDGIAWCVALTYYRMAVTWTGIHARYQAGMTVGEGFDYLGAHVPTLIDRAMAALEGRADFQ